MNDGRCPDSGMPGWCAGRAIVIAAGMFYGLPGALNPGMKPDWLPVADCPNLQLHGFPRNGEADVPAP